MIRNVFMTSLAGLFSAAAVNCAAAQLDCSSGDIACTTNCQILPPELGVACQTYCLKDREECEERVKQNESVQLQKQQRRREEKKQRRQPSPTSKKRTGSPAESPRPIRAATEEPTWFSIGSAKAAGLSWEGSAFAVEQSARARPHPPTPDAWLPTPKGRQPHRRC
jgi:hypothetical protein